MQRSVKKRGGANEPVRPGDPSWEIAKHLVGENSVRELSFTPSDWDALQPREQDALLHQKAGEFLLALPRLGAQRPAVLALSRNFVTHIRRSLTDREVDSFRRAAHQF